MNVVRAAGSDKVITPEAALDLWGRGALRDLLRLPDDGGKVEIIDGVIVVTPAPFFGHAAIARPWAALVALRVRRCVRCRSGGGCRRCPGR